MLAWGSLEYNKKIAVGLFGSVEKFVLLLLLLLVEANAPDMLTNCVKEAGYLILG